MKTLLIALSIVLLSTSSFADEPKKEMKKVCIKKIDAKTKKEALVCKTMRVHKKLDVKDSK